ncbi:MAG: aminoacyl-histidine dipeptidase [Bacteroidales bacterium]|nr:aminoacyl-histidine dipeptidase [Bacteroidales bacterium]
MNSANVLEIFKEITKVPRESGHEEKIIKWLEDFAKAHGLECRTDKAGNVLIIKEADKGYENAPTIILQSHSDMVCEKNSGSSHDFEKDPIPFIIEDGWMIAPETTLGADCGIGMACALELVSGKTPTGRLEALFTVSEETGLDGAMALEAGFMSGNILINLDSEDEGEIFVGCAGGLDTTAKFSYRTEPVCSCLKQVGIKISGLLGGHSGDDINKGHATAVQRLGSLLYDLVPDGYKLLRIDGGNKRNAIAREASAVIALDPAKLDAVRAKVGEFEARTKEEYGNVECNIKVELTECKKDITEAIDDSTALRLVTCLTACPHGVLAMSQEIPGFVETSTNLASVKMTEPGIIRLGTSQRSCVTAARRAAGRKVEAAFVAVGAEVRHESEYPGWAPAAVSDVRDRFVASYRKLFGCDPAVKAIHAGLECGLFTEVYPNLDMVSVGPTLRGVHAPGEKLDLKSLDKFVALLEDVIVNYK